MINLKANKLILLPLLSILLLSSCTGKLYIEKSANYEYNINKIKKIVSIEPNFVYNDQRRPDYTQIVKSAKKEADLEKILVKNAKKNKIILEVYNAEAIKDDDVDYYNDLVPLANQLLFANVTQETPSELSGSSSDFLSNWVRPKTEYFEFNPRIVCDHSTLIKKYKTRYFAVQGVVASVDKNPMQWLFGLWFPPMAFKANAQSYYFVVLVDVEKGEVIYREIRGIYERAFKDNLNAMVYDSFKTMKKK